MEALKPEAQAVAEIVRKNVEPRVQKLEHDGIEASVLITTDLHGAAVVHSVKKLLDEYRTEPERRTGTAELSDVASFCAHVNRFKDEDSAIFADTSRTAPSLTAVLDYHRAGADSEPRFGKHRAAYRFPLSEPWKAWIGQSGKALSQEAFAQWLESRLLDVTDPADAGDQAKAIAQKLGLTFTTPARLLALSKELDLNVGKKLAQQINRTSGEAKVTFVEEHTNADGTPVSIPNAFLLSLPVFDRGSPALLPCRLRYRVNGQAITFAYEVHRADETIDYAINTASKMVEAATKLPVYCGKPEGG